MTVEVTAHALERYRRRFDRRAAAADVADLAEGSVAAPGWLAAAVARHPSHRAGREARVAGGCVLIVDAWGYGRVTVVTVLTLARCEQQAGLVAGAPYRGNRRGV